MRVYDARDASCTGVGLGPVWPETAEVQEDAGGDYVLRLSVPVADGSGWEWIRLERQIVALCPAEKGVSTQRFRVHAASLSGDGKKLEVQARHITYDLQYVISDTGETPDSKISAAQAGEKLWDGIEDSCAFALHVTAAGKVYAGWGRCSVTKALLDQSAGLVRSARARLLRDNTDIWLLPPDPEDSGVTIRRGLDLLGLTADGDATECYTHLIPTGLDEDGEVLFLPERAIDSPRSGDYALRRAYTWQVSGAQIGLRCKQEDGGEKKLTRDDVYRLLREAAQEKLDAGCDLPASGASVEYIDLGRTREHPELAGLQTVRLYQTITVLDGPIGLALTKTVSGYTWDPILLRYRQLRLGDPFADGSQGSFVTAAQRASDRQSYGAASAFVATKLEDYARFTVEQTEYTNALRVELDAVQGTITQLATSDQLSQTDHTISVVQQRIDAMDARIDLKANSDTVEDQGVSLSAAWTALDALNADVQLLASKTELNNLTQRVSKAEMDLDGAEALIALKASQDSVTSLDERVESISLELDGKVGVATLDGYLKVTDSAEILGMLQTEDLTCLTLGANDVYADIHAYDIWTERAEVSDTLTVKGDLLIGSSNATDIFAAIEHTHSAYMGKSDVSWETVYPTTRIKLNVRGTSKTLPLTTHTHTITIDGVTYKTGVAT